MTPASTTPTIKQPANERELAIKAINEWLSRGLTSMNFGRDIVRVIETAGLSIQIAARLPKPDQVCVDRELFDRVQDYISILTDETDASKFPEEYADLFVTGEQLRQALTAAGPERAEQGR